MPLPHIVIIHDDWTETSPLVVDLKEKYTDANVKFIKHSQEGIDYIMKAPVRKTIVLLDYNFKTGEPTGGDVFKKIRERSSLIFVIIVTKSQYKNINPDDFVDFVNNHALAIARASDDYTAVSALVDEAKSRLDNRADVILEEWISKKSEEDRAQPYMLLANGKSYNLNDILTNIRQQTALGQSFTQDVLELAIELIMKKMGPKNV